MKGFTLRLYVSGRSASSLRALENLRRICQEMPACESVEVVDVRERPELAEADRILLTPTLLKVAPEPACRIVGDLSDLPRVLLGLGVTDAA